VSHHERVPLDNDGLRDCAQGIYCASSTLAHDENGGQVRVPFRGPRAFCSPDRGKIETALAELPRLYAALAAELGQPAQGTGATRSPFGPKVPLRVGIDALMRLYAEVLTSWHERVAAVARLTPPPEQVRAGWAIARAVDVIAPRLDALLALEAEPMRRAVSHRELELLGDVDGIVRPGYVAIMPDLSGADAGLEILALHRRSRAILGETRERPVELLGVPCRECDYLSLRRAELPSDPDEDAPWSECSECGAVMDEAEYREWVALCAAYERHRTPPATLENLPGVA
jgi:hypothetical protein